MVAPITFLVLLSKYKAVYFPNLEELSFRKVLAFPKASSKGLQFKILSSIGTNPILFRAPWILVRKAMHRFALSVFPAPDSPEIQIA